MSGMHMGGGRQGKREEGEEEEEGGGENKWEKGREWNSSARAAPRREETRGQRRERPTFCPTPHMAPAKAKHNRRTDRHSDSYMTICFDSAT